MARPSKFEGQKTVDRLLELAAQGKFDSAIARDLGVSRKTLFNWADDPANTDFKAAMDQREELRRAYYEELTRKVISGEQDKFSTAQKDLLVRTLTTQFHDTWTEHKKTTLEITDKTKQMSDDELEDLIQRKIKQAAGLKPDLKVIKDDSK